VIDRDLLLDDLKNLTADLVDDLRDRTEEVPNIHSKIHRQYDAAQEAGRTDQSFEEWREDLLAQVAVGWVLATVFVRFCEDNDLYETPLLSGPGERRDLAGDRRADWLADHSEAGDREWLEEIFRRYQGIPATEELFGEKNPLWQFGPSADGAKAVIELWQRVDTESGGLRHNFTDPDLDTRFLGDLYQDLSEHAKKKFALLQTPEFVEEFILDRTLDPAIETFGLEEIRMIDPACGSGHFLLGAFDRILELWREREPGTPIRDLVQRTLDAVNGVDLNPYAVEIARFRLLVAALKASEIDALEDAPAFKMNVAVGDSLIHGRRSGELFAGPEGFGDMLEHRYPTENRALANQLLRSGKYHAVVGNPPYITVKDKAARDVYRALYETAWGHYSLAVPFKERFFDLAVPSHSAGSAGFVGLITANSFMKRQFGKVLIEEFLPRVDLTHIIDTSGAYIPGHGTPTVILLGRHQKPQGERLRAVLGIRGEPGTPTDAATGEVWTSIASLIEKPGSENSYVSVEDVPRERYRSHPWSLQGGAAPEIKRQMEDGSIGVLGELTDEIGYGAVTREDEVFWVGGSVTHRKQISEVHVKPYVAGEDVRDWCFSNATAAIWPYNPASLKAEADHALLRFLWPFRRRLKQRVAYGKTQLERGLRWWEYSMFFDQRFRTPLTISFADVATHNHFVLDRGGRVFNRTAPIVTLPQSAGEGDYFEVLGLLNSSAACFWMKQVYHCKGSTVDKRGARQTTVPFEDFYQFDATKLKLFPVPEARDVSTLSRSIDQLAQRLTETLPSSVVADSSPTEVRLEGAKVRAEDLRARMVAFQEELDWACYKLYGLSDKALTAPPDQVPKLKKGQRAFEIVLARIMAAGRTESTWFERHDSMPITELPDHWSEPYRRTVERRIDLIESDRAIRLLEKPEHKRRWNWDSWEDLQEEALEKWLLDRLEAKEFWAEPELMTSARLTDRVLKDEAFVGAARLYAGRVDVDLTELVTSLVMDQAVPFAVGYRFNASGMRRRREWEKVWELQRQEDAIDARTELPNDDSEHLTEEEAEALKEERGLADIPVPPKYRKKDYSDNTAYSLRGNLDVPKERFISYPDTRKGADTTPVIGWAGWDHLERARALASHYTARKEQGAEDAELVPLLAGLQELVPWLQQWHNEMDPTYGQRMGEFFASFVADEARALDRTVEELKTWTPD
jgi:SAM-dependent methyltransferase